MRRRIVIVATAALLLMALVAPAASAVKPPRIPAWYNGDVVVFTVVSDNVVDKVSPGIAKHAATLYAFGFPPDQPQIDVLDSVPGDPGYNPWWHVVLVEVLDERDVTVDPFTSEAEILAAADAEEVALIPTGFHFLCQVLPNQTPDPPPA